MLSSSTGADNTAIGTNALRANTTGSNNVCLGHHAGYSGTNNLTTGSNNILIGHDAAASAATVSNEITLGDTAITKFRVPGLNFSIKDSTATDNYVLTVDSNGDAGWEEAAGAVADGCLYENSQSITNNYTIASGKGAHAVGPLAISATLTINGVLVIS